jgi:hypothetical protein
VLEAVEELEQFHQLQAHEYFMLVVVEAVLM